MTDVGQKFGFGPVGQFCPLFRPFQVVDVPAALPYVLQNGCNTDRISGLIILYQVQCLLHGYRFPRYLVHHGGFTRPQTFFEHSGECFITVHPAAPGCVKLFKRHAQYMVGGAYSK